MYCNNKELWIFLLSVQYVYVIKLNSFSSSVLQYLFHLFFSSSSSFVRRWQYQATNDTVQGRLG